MNRDEHVAWAKERAIAELDAGGPRATVTALASVTSDLGKHPDTADHSAILLMGMLAMGGHLNNDRKVREFITGIR